MKRNPDGTWRNARHPIVISTRIVIARWVTAEILRCKRTGLSMAAIAVHIAARCEEMYLKLQSGISKGDPRHVDAAVRVLAHKAKLNGYATEPEQVSGPGGLHIQIHLGDECENERVSHISEKNVGKRPISGIQCDNLDSRS